MPAEQEQHEQEQKKRMDEWGKETDEHAAAERAAEKGRPYKAEEARVRVASGAAVVLDIRGQEEWDNGWIPGARHVDENDLAAALEDVPGEKQVIVVCEDGSRSRNLAKRLSEDEDRDATHIEGGMKAWGSAHLPTEPSEDPDTPL